MNAQVYIIAIIGADNGTGNVINSAASLSHGFGGAA